MLETDELSECIRAARRERKSDIVLKNCRIVNVFNGQIETENIAVCNGVIVGYGDHSAETVFDLDGRFLVPGFIDGHIHIESSMLSPVEFSRAVIVHGTTAVVADPHEIANVLGLEGIRYFLEESKKLPTDIFYMAPSCVPATDMETSGATLGVEELTSLHGEKRIIGLAEVMNFPGVINASVPVLEKLSLFSDKVIDGHAPLLSGSDLDAYLISGVSSDHECTHVDEAREKLSKGMWVMIREGSQSKDLASLSSLINPVTSRRCMLVSDDSHPDDLFNVGHMDYIVTKAIGEGIDPISAIQMATINPAQYFGLKHRGAIVPGYIADFFVCGSLDKIEPEMVFKNGNLVARSGVAEFSFRECRIPENTLSMNVADILPEVLGVRAEKERIRVIGVLENQLITQQLIVDAPVKHGCVVSDPERDILKIAVIERHKGTGNIAIGYVNGFGLKRGAIASSVAHDSHNIVVVGCDDISMLKAIDTIKNVGGGLAVTEGENTRALLPLPIAGLLSIEPLKKVVIELEKLRKSYRALGGTLSNPFMALSFLALPVIPELKITDKGLVDVSKFEFVPLFV